MDLYKVVIKRYRDEKVLKENLSKSEAQELKNEWLTIFNPEVFMDPVPEVLVKKMKPEADEE